MTDDAPTPHEAAAEAAEERIAARIRVLSGWPRAALEYRLLELAGLEPDGLPIAAVAELVALAERAGTDAHEAASDALERLQAAGAHFTTTNHQEPRNAHS